METANSITQRVQEGLAANHSAIVINVFQHLVKKHNDVNCSCDYCMKLRPYVNAKRVAQRFKRYMDSDEAYYSERPYSIDQERYYAMKRNIARMKIEKDQLKLILTPGNSMFDDFGPRGECTNHGG